VCSSDDSEQCLASPLHWCSDAADDCHIILCMLIS
jgi:hypothetical protein